MRTLGRMILPPSRGRAEPSALRWSNRAIGPIGTNNCCGISRRGKVLRGAHGPSILQQAAVRASPAPAW